jgi:hypothetical protein
MHWFSHAAFSRIENPSKVFLAKNKFIASQGNAGKMQFSAGWQNKRFLHVGSRSKFEAIFGSGMRAFFAILGLLLCLIETCADELPVIKDSEAVHYVGKNVELRGLVVSVTTSPLGATFINFGREYPNQMFAGFIAAGSKMTTDQRIATLQGKSSQSNFTEGNRRSKSCRQIRSKI